MKQGLTRLVNMVRAHVFLFGLVLGVAFIYSLLALLLHWHFLTSGFDLGIFDQAVWHYSQFEAPASTIKGTANLLGDHFHPILAVLAPLYWVFNSAVVLLIAQAVLFAVSVVPVFLFVRKRLGTAPAYLFSGAYAMYWGIQTAAGYNFHEIAFAVPLIAFAIYFADLKAWGRYFVCIGLLLLVKEDQSFLVAFFGLFLLTQRHFKQAIASFVLGIGWFFLATKLFIPLFAGPKGFAYWSFDQFGPDLISSLKTILKNPLLVIQVMIWPRIKVVTGFRIFSPFLLLAFASPLIILAVPLIGERFLSTRQDFWWQTFHYTATISPIVAMASADGLRNLSRLIRRERWRRYVILAVSIVVLALNIWQLPKFQLWTLTHPGAYGLSAAEKAGYRALKVIPAGASVTTQDAMAPHLSQRKEVYLLLGSGQKTDYVIASRSVSPYPAGSHDEVEGYVNEYQKAGYVEVFAEEGWVVLRRGR